MRTIDETFILTIIFFSLMIIMIIGIMSLVDLAKWAPDKFSNISKEKKYTRYLCETLISELETSPTINSDYSFMNNIDSYLIADTLKGGHYIDIKIKQDKDCTITKRIEAKTFEKLMRKARVWYLENK